MDLVSILTTVILATTIGTTIIGLAAYAAFKLRDKRKPTGQKSTANKDEVEYVFFSVYRPDPVDADANV